MPTPSTATRSSPYAALAAQKPACAESVVLTAVPISPPPPDPFLLEESKKLQLLKDALWDAFLASRTTAIPLPLIDLTFAYTGMLKLQLSLLTASTDRR